MVLARHSVGLSAKSYDDISERTVVCVGNTGKQYAARVYIKFITLLNVVVYHCAEEIVSGCDGVEVSREVEVDIFHREHLRISASCRSAFKSENRSERRLAKCDNGFFSDFGKCHAKSYRCCGFAFACGSGIYRRYENQLSVGFIFKSFGTFGCDFRLVFAVQLKLIFRYIKLTCNLPYRFHLGFLRDFNISKHFYSPRVLNL